MPISREKEGRAIHEESTITAFGRQKLEEGLTPAAKSSVFEGRRRIRHAFKDRRLCACAHEETGTVGWVGGCCSETQTVVAAEGVHCLPAVSADLRDAQCK